MKHYKFDFVHVTGHDKPMRFRVLAVVGVVGRIIGRPETDPGE
jgi:hypothetical protein